MAPKNKENYSRSKKSKEKAMAEESSDDEYRKKRDRNNQAVKRSRVKSRIRTQETMERVQKLKTENDMLEEKIKYLSQELGFLKELFLAHASNSPNNVKLEGLDLQALLSDTQTSLLNNNTYGYVSSTSALETQDYKRE